MFNKLEKWAKGIRRLGSRSRWLAKTLGFPSSEGPSNRPGLVLIQIDGLSQIEFRRALNRGEMPFLKRLLDRENYQEHSQYSGLPASTPAVQGELFYGVKTCVPAFAFRDPKARKIKLMYEPATAAVYDADLIEQSGGEPLMKDGSAYSNIFTGGASESHFVAATMGAKDIFLSANPFTLALLVIANLGSVVRIIGLMLLEVVIAVSDFITGVFRGRSVLMELKFIPQRIIASIFLREAIVIGAKIDIERGLPIVQMNFVGYDEQSHRRGPRSRFAHWSLKGIDNAIKRVWNAAHKAHWRQYDVWIYSDHGQCKAKSIWKVTGYEIEEAINRAFDKLNLQTPHLAVLKRKRNVQRCCLLGSHNEISKHANHGEITDADLEEGRMQVANLGPIGFIYPDRMYSPEELMIVAESLVHEHAVPVAAVRNGGGEFVFISKKGRFRLPQDTGELFGHDHPFLQDIGDDLLRVCKHSCAGDIAIIGWCEGSESITFIEENGSHAGLTPEETNAFSLLPRDTQLPDNGKNYMRPCELRAAALHFLGRKLYEGDPTWRPFSVARAGETLRVMTYNVHSCIGLDGKLDVARISRVIAQSKPDVVCLQELDLRKIRSGGDDQAQLIAKLLEMNYQFHPALRMEEEEYGDAVLTHLPMKTMKVGVLPGTKPDSSREPRGALWVTVNYNGTDVHIINTHLGLSSSEQMQQVDALLGEDWLQPLLDSQDPIVFCGDFNCHPRSRPYRRLTTKLDDAQHRLKNHRAKNTFYTRFPLFRIDHIFVNERVEVVNIEVPRSRTAMRASDHLPLIAELKVLPLAID
jgi:endonuclease/exonuclease/phosphatase family metal-dependent hydrolase